ncbi:hypothetical protein PCL_06196 [Purpureocillium lilacinum]|uniref:Uncharacterized protein n=1 Tax=Purpureocillium lilacinum TaxID=33203 RepID=A0A2U3ELZ2_PURLI|nr:hypothetical protein PCL_06196 [Purpureocillium lilacinum]
MNLPRESTASDVSAGRRSRAVVSFAFPFGVSPLSAGGGRCRHVRAGLAQHCPLKTGLVPVAGSISWCRCRRVGRVVSRVVCLRRVAPWTLPTSEMEAAMAGRGKWQAARLVMGPEGRARAESWTKCVVYILTRPRRARKASHLILVARPHATASPNLLWILVSQAPNQTHEPGPLTTIEQIGLALGFPSPAAWSTHARTHARTPTEQEAVGHAADYGSCQLQLAWRTLVGRLLACRRRVRLINATGPLVGGGVPLHPRQTKSRVCARTGGWPADVTGRRGSGKARCAVSCSQHRHGTERSSSARPTVGESSASVGGGRWEVAGGSSMPGIWAAIIGSARGSSPKCIVPDGPDWTNATGRCGGFGSAFKEPQGAREPVVATASLPRDGRSASGVLEFVRSRLKPLLPRRPQSHREQLQHSNDSNDSNEGNEGNESNDSNRHRAAACLRKCAVEIAKAAWGTPHLTSREADRACRAPGDAMETATGCRRMAEGASIDVRPPRDGFAAWPGAQRQGTARPHPVDEQDRSSQTRPGGIRLQASLGQADVGTISRDKDTRAPAVTPVNTFVTVVGGLVRVSTGLTSTSATALRQSEQAARPSVALVLHDTTAGIDGRDIASTADPPPLSASPSPRAQRSPSMGL